MSPLLTVSLGDGSNCQKRMLVCFMKCYKMNWAIVFALFCAASIQNICIVVSMSTEKAVVSVTASLLFSCVVLVWTGSGPLRVRRSWKRS